MSAFTYREAIEADAEALAAFARASWVATFGENYPRADLEAYLAKSFGADIQRAQISNPGESYLLAFEGDEIVGYCRMGPVDMPVDATGAVELHRLYVHARVQGKGVAAALMDQALEWARARGARAIYLSVWENNPRAQAFYRRYGFADHSEWSFMVGGVADRDLIWKLAL